MTNPDHEITSVSTPMGLLAEMKMSANYISKMTNQRMSFSGFVVFLYRFWREHGLGLPVNVPTSQKPMDASRPDKTSAKSAS